MSAMKSNIDKIKSLESLNEYYETANAFERIAAAENDKWLPYYYSAWMYTMISYIDTVADHKDGYLDKADGLLVIADSLSPDNSEIYTLKGMAAQGRLQIDPMNRWMKYGSASTKNFQKAVEIDTLNPRPEYLMGMNIYYTPEQFGGGPAAALPYFEKSLAKYEAFKPENDIMPNWGKESVEAMISQIKK
jgi:tetratricopeptide (TPR) repeat protein